MPTNANPDLAMPKPASLNTQSWTICINSNLTFRTELRLQHKVSADKRFTGAVGFPVLPAVAFMAEQFRTRPEHAGLENKHPATTPVLGRGLGHPSPGYWLLFLFFTAINL